MPLIAKYYFPEQTKEEKPGVTGYPG